MKIRTVLFALIHAATAYEITLKGTCDNYMDIFLSEDGGSTYSELTDGWSGNLDNWSVFSTKTLELDSLAESKLKIKCYNAANECEGSKGGLIFGVYYDGTWYSTDGGNDNNGYYELTDSKSGITTAQDTEWTWGGLLFENAQWTWTCGVSDSWACDACGEFNEYVFDFSVIDPCADVSCSDGNMCNGEEYCDSSTGECVDGEEIECPNLFYCDEDAQGCVRDCTTFAIDGYLRDCSAEFDENENELYSLDERVTGLEADVVNIASTVTSNTETIEANTDSIGVNEGAITANAESITSLQEELAADIAANVESIASLQEELAADAAAAEERLAAIEDHLLALGPQVDHGEGTGESTASASASGIVDLYVFKEYRGEWFLFLAAMNVILCICLMCQRYGEKRGKNRYAPVKMYSSAEENVQLRDANKI